MNISKAIAILESRVTSPFVRANPDSQDAIKLGIEAMKHINHNRLVNNHPDQALLPGETKE